MTTAEVLAQLGQVPAPAIDPRDYGRMEAEVAGLKAEMAEVKRDLLALTDKMDQVLAKLNEAKGGWKLMMALGGAAASLGAIVTWFASHTIHIGPRG